MGAMPGYRQVSLYIDPSLYSQVQHVARMTGRTYYQFVNDALKREIEKCTSPEERKALELILAKQQKVDKGKKNGTTADHARTTEREADRRKR